MPKVLAQTSSQRPTQKTIAEVSGFAITTVSRALADDPLIARFGLAESMPAWGRLATIFADGRPMIDLLEIVRPE